MYVDKAPLLLLKSQVEGGYTQARTAAVNGCFVAYAQRVSPLQRIGLGLAIVLLPANFPAHPDPPWEFYNALPSPLGWLMVLWGLQSLAHTTTLSLRPARAAAVIAAIISVPMWFPQINHYLVPEYNPGVSQSWQWLVTIPLWAFAYFLTKAWAAAARAQGATERRAAGWFDALQWGFLILGALPAVVLGAHLDKSLTIMYLLIGIVQWALIIVTFIYHRRTWLGGPGPRVWATNSTRTPTQIAEHKEWQNYRAERQRMRTEIRKRRRERRSQTQRPE